MTCAALISLVAAAAAAQTDDIASHIINDPGAPQVNGAKALLRNDPKVQGGKAIRVEVAAKGKNPWDSSIGSPINKPVKAGDQIVLAFWARVEKAENGATTVTLPYAAVQQAASPWKPILNDSVELGPEWKLLQVRGTADRDYAAGALAVTVQLATARQTIDFGPIVVLDLGKAQ
jgi:hypothetical protein